MTFTPNNLVANRTARLVRETTAPVYTTETRTTEREHLTMVEIDSPYGRRWSAPMPDSEVTGYIDMLLDGDELSDIDHAAKCWCQ